jgi:hypothetical protein
MPSRTLVASMEVSGFVNGRTASMGAVIAITRATQT